MKKLTVLLIVMMLILSFAACGKSAEPQKEEEPKLADGEYVVRFNTDSSMFHANEVDEGCGVLFVENGEMTLFVRLAGTGIVNLYVGKAEDAQKEGAEVLDPVEVEVEYPDGAKETVYGFYIPVKELDTDFDCAILGKKGTWYDHVVSVSSPEE